MAGHSKWKSIKHAKAVTDSRRSARFTKMIREITMAAKLGGGDPGGNPRLRTAIETARSQSLPKDNIERAVKKGTGELEGADYVEVLYEAYGPGGAALMIQALTDNPTRTVADIRHKLSRGGGNLGTTNSVAFLFNRQGLLTFDASQHDEDALMLAALDAGAEDLAREDEQFVVSCEASMLHAVKSALEEKGFTATETELSWVPGSTVRVEGEAAGQLVKLLEAIEDLDDVQNVDTNADLDIDALDEQ